MVAGLLLTRFQAVDQMIRIEASVIVNAPVEKIWNFMADFDTMTQWGRGYLEVKWQRPISVGSIVVVTAQGGLLLGRRTANMKITDWEPTRKMGVEARSGGAKANAVITMEPLEGGKTRLARSAQVEIGGLLKLIQPYIAYRMKRVRSAELDNVKRIVEAQNSGA